MTTLWEPDAGSPKASRRESERVRRLYWEEKTRLLGWEHPAGHRCEECGAFRGQLARDWVSLCYRTGYHSPGQDVRRPLREGETELERRVDAARTRLRQFEAGQAQAEWVLVGIEGTICDRRGLALPGRMYVVQGALL